MAAALDVVGAMTGAAVATTGGRGIVPLETSILQLVAAALISAISWNLFTWWSAIPSTSSHALVFSIVGAGIASAGIESIQIGGLAATFQGIVFAPVLGFIVAVLLLIALLWIFARSRPLRVTRVFGRPQVLSAACMAFSHDSNDAQKTMGAHSMALASIHGWTGDEWRVPQWVIIAAAAMGLGTAVGGWRIVGAMGLHVAELRPIDGIAAETAAATEIEAISRLGIPLSTTQVISSSIFGAGATRSLSAVRWGIPARIVTAWVVTIPACVALAWAVFQVLHFITGVP